MPREVIEEEKRRRGAWCEWLRSYGAENFLNHFLANAQDAESICVNCNQRIYLDVIEGGGVPDWCTSDGDYGCSESPDTNDEGTGSHVPRKGR